MTTIVIGQSGRVYDLGMGEFPPSDDRPTRNAKTVTKEEAFRLRKGRKYRTYNRQRDEKP